MFVCHCAESAPTMSGESGSAEHADGSSGKVNPERAVFISSSRSQQLFVFL